MTMNHHLALPGLTGIALAFLLYSIASALSTLIPNLLQGTLTAIAFAFCLLLSIIEIPMMVFGLRQMAHNATTPRRWVVGTFAFYVMFAAVYASIFVLLTGQIIWGTVLAAQSLVRFASGLALR